jgi:translation initiation factor IF-3
MGLGRPGFAQEAAVSTGRPRQVPRGSNAVPFTGLRGLSLLCGPGFAAGVPFGRQSTTNSAVGEVRLVGDNVEPCVMKTQDAINLALEMELDLVEISPKAVPPVCRITEYKKFLYDQKKKQKEIKAKQQKVVVKEIRFGPNTDDHDFQFKLKHARKFLEEGSKLKAYVFFRGRTIVFKERGEIFC